MSSLKNATQPFKEALNLPYQEPTPPAIATEEFRKVVQTRRSVRVFEDSPIPPDVVRDCLELSLLSPNSSNLQAWGFYWAKSPQLKAALAEACLSQPAAKTAAELIVCIADPDAWRPHAKEMVGILQAQKGVPQSAIDYYRVLAPFVYAQGPFSLWGRIKSLLFFLRGLTTPTPREPASHPDMQVWATKSSALACQTLMLAFRAHGYDTCPLEGFDSARVKKLLKLKRHQLVVMIVAAGKRAPKGIYGPRLRFDSSRFIHEV